MARIFYEPKDGHPLKHNPFNAIIAPRPIGWISSQNADGEANLAPYSFFNAFNYTPPIIGFASTGDKDTLKNVKATGEFCWNLVDTTLVEAMNTSSAAVAYGVDEFALASLEKAKARIVNAPFVKRAKVVFECRVSQIVPLLGHDGDNTGTTMVFGEVVAVHIDDALVVDGVFSTDLAAPVLRAGGQGDYYRLNPKDKFTLLRP